MNLSDFKKELARKHIESNGLTDSFISKTTLMQCKDVLPERINVGIDSKGNRIFFEETAGSLQKKHYKKTKGATSFNLLYSDGKKSEKVTVEYLNDSIIKFENDDYDLNVLFKFVENNNNRFNALGRDKRIKCSFYLTEGEIETVQEFIRKMRKFKGEN